MLSDIHFQPMTWVVADGVLRVTSLVFGEDATVIATHSMEVPIDEIERAITLYKRGVSVMLVPDDPGVDENEE